MWKVTEVLAVSFSSIKNDYRMAGNKESRCNKKVTMTLPHLGQIRVLIDL